MVLEKLKSFRGLLYGKVITELSKKGYNELPGFSIGKPARIVEFPELKDLRKINITYSLIEPFAYANVKWDDETKELVYYVVEPEMSAEEKKLLEKISDALIELIEIGVSALKEMSKAIEYLEKQVKKVIKEFGLVLTPNQYVKIMYYIYRNFLGFNKIEPLLQDPYIEDISCDGIGLPIYIIHRKFGSLKTNVVFDNLDDLREFIIKLAERCGRYVTYAEPILDGTLPDGSRVSATLAGDVATRGPTFTIRKFGEKPFSPVEQMELGTASSEMLAYYWYLMEHEFSMFIVGGTATGKTSFLNTLCMFIPPEAKIVSIEDSILADCEMLVEINNKITKVKVGELIDNILRKNKTILPDGTEIGYANNIRVFSLNSNGKIVLSNPSSFIRHKVKKKILDIVLSSGKKISVTKDHSLFTLDENCNISPISGDEISVGTFIATPRLISANCNDMRINLLDYPFIISECFAKKIGNEIKIYSKKSKPKYAIPINIEVDENLATLIGLWLADGSYDKNSIIFSVDSEGKKIVKRVAKKFGLTPKLHSDGFSLMLNSSPLKKCFKVILKLDGNAYTKQIPTWIYNLPNDKVAAILKGYFSGDGWMRKSDIAVRSSSLQLLRDIQTLLLRFGIPLRISRKRLKDKTYEARISGSKFIKIFRDKIGFIQKHKQKKLDEACKRRIHDVSDVIPLPKNVYREIKKALKKHVEKKFSYTRWKNWAGKYLYFNQNIGREHLKKIIRLLDNELKERLKMLAESDIFWDRIVEIKERDYEGYVYDLGVHENENFVCNNIIAHNTREIRIPHEHWISGLVRVGFGIPMPTGEKYGEVTLFDLLKESFRQNPDYVIVGEVRGQEAYVMFQGMASGHACLSTFHSGSIDTLIKRLTTPPIELPISLIESLHVITIMVHAKEKGKSARRVKEVVEIESVDPKTGEVKTRTIFKWNPVTDTYEKVGESIKIREAVESKGGKLEDALIEIERRRKILEWMKERGIRDYLEVRKIINQYYKEPNEVLKMIGEKKEIKPPEVKLPIKVKEEKPKKRVSILELLGFKIIREK